MKLALRWMSLCLLLLTSLTVSSAVAATDLEVDYSQRVPLRIAYGQLRWGVVAAKGRVLGPNQKPIWAEYGADGNVVSEIGEAHGDPLENALVMSAHAYRTYVEAFKAVQAQYGQQSQVLTRSEYETRTFIGPNNTTLVKPALSAQTNCVVVRDPAAVYGAMSLLLHESPLDLNRLENVSDTDASVLLSAQGWVIKVSAYNIGFRTAFYTPKGSTEHEEYNNYVWGKDTLNNFYLEQDQLWGPVMGVPITVFGNPESTSSDEEGRFAAFRTLGCDIATHIEAKIRYHVFNPKGKFPGQYVYIDEWPADCFWVPECMNPPPLYSGGGIAGTFGYMSWLNDCAGTVGGLYLMPPLKGIDHFSKSKIQLDVAFVTGSAMLRNPSGVIVNGEQTTYAYTPPLAIPYSSGPNRVEDKMADFSNQGLLQTISAADMDNTDIYIFRTSNDQLIMSREGLAEKERAPMCGNCVDQNQGRINYHMVIRGPGSDRNYIVRKMPDLRFENFQAAVNVNPTLRGQMADHLRIGEQIKVVIVNRATGYIGTAIGVFGSPAVGIYDTETGEPIDTPVEVQDSSLIQIAVPPIYMQPPNLKITAERVFETQTGMTAGRWSMNTIGFEGAGLTSDQYIRVTTEWYDHNGTPLPAELPGFTGRLAKVVRTNLLAPVAGQMANFEILPGRHTQMVMLPQEKVDDAHFYIHVNGEPREGNPSFAELGAAPSGPLQYRPAHYVPFQVPIFDEVSTLALAQAQAASLKSGWKTGDPIPVLDNIEKIYKWPYRPEMQFSLFDLEIDELEMITDIDGSSGADNTSVSFNYDLIQSPYDPLAPLGPGHDLVFGLGYAEIAALIGENQHAQFASIDELLAMNPAQQYQYVSAMLNQLQPEDFLGLQLYQNSDAGNSLVEIYGLPLVAMDNPYTEKNPLEFTRQHYSSQFNSSLPGGIGAGYTDDYRVFDFALFQQSQVSVNLLNSAGEHRAELIRPTLLAQGQFSFIVDYGDIHSAGFDSGLNQKFTLQIVAQASDHSRTQRIRLSGTLKERTEGQVLGQIMVHDVLIQDGSLNLSRSDASLPGRGPELAFSRSYSNLTPGKGQKPLGPGWRHNYQMELQALSTTEHGNGSVPNWVPPLKGNFIRPSQLPDLQSDWTSVAVNGTIFIKVNNTWYPERGRHGSLVQGQYEFVYTAKDGTRYYYDVPIYTSAVKKEIHKLPSLNVGDSLVTRINLAPEQLQLTQDTSEPIKVKEVLMPGPNPIKRIVDRNGNTLQFEYDAYGRLLSVNTDAAERKLTFAYQVFGLSNDRLVSVSGPQGLVLAFAYDANGLLQSATRADRTETYAYERELSGFSLGEFNLASVTDDNGHTTSYEYYAEGQIPDSVGVIVKVLKDYDAVKSVSYPGIAGPAQFAYNAETDNKRTVTDMRGNATTYYLNYYGNPVRIEEPLGKITRMTWSIDQGRDDNVMTSKSDPRDPSWVTHYEYDGKGNITVETDPYGHTTTTTWDLAFSQPLTRTDRNGVAQSWQYDSHGNLLTFTDGDLKAHTYTYYATGERQTGTTPKGDTTHYTYDGYGNPDTVTGPEGSVTNFDYDVRGRKISETDPRNNPTTYTYNALDQVTQVTHPQMTAYALPAGSSRTETRTYDAVGNLLTQTDRLGLTQTFTYTPRNQVATITRNIGGAKTFGYDPNGNLTSESDWKGVPTTHAYDALNRRTGTTNRLLHPMSMGYDLAGNLTSQTDFEGQETTFVYDRLNRQTEIHMPDLDGQNVVVTKTYYNEADPDTNLATETDPEGHTTTYFYNGRYQRTKRTNALSRDYIWAYDDNGNLASETDEETNTTSYTYDRQDRRTETHRAGIRTALAAFDAAGNVTAVTDARNNRTTTAYDQWNRAYQVTLPGDIVTTTRLDGAGNKVFERDGNGHERTWEYYPNGLVKSFTDAEQHTTGHAYDLNGNLTSTTFANGAETRTTYDAEDRELTITEAFGSDQARTRQVLERDKNGNPLRTSDFNGNVARLTYNGLNLVERSYDAAGNYSEKKYYRTGTLRTERNRRGHTTTYAYDALNRLTKVTDPLNQSVDTTYDHVGNVATVTDKRRIVTQNFYDAFYRLIRTERAGTRLVTNEYDAVGNLTAVIDAENHRTEHHFNARNLKDLTTFADTTTNRFTYDNVGNLLTRIDELNQTTSYTYDQENHQKTVTFANETTEFAYDVMGNKTAEIKPKGNRRALAYNRLNQLTRVTDDPDGLNLSTRFEYDPNGNLRHQYDARDNHVEYTYDSLNRKTAHIQHKTTGNLTVGYTQYDAEGNLTAMTDAMGREFTFTHDELHRETNRTAPDIDSPFNQTTQVVTAYDANNNVASVTEIKTREDNTTFTDVTVNTYDNFDRLDTTTQRGLLTDYVYDANGNRTSVATPAGTTTYTFDNRNRLSTATADGVTTYTYTADGKQDTVTYPNGTRTEYDYTAANRIQSISHTRVSDASLISAYSYTYDANGNRTQQIETQNNADETTDYTYDALDRLVSFTVTGAKTTVTAYTYEAYNRKTETVTEDGTVIKQRSHTYDQADWLTRIDDTTNPPAPYTIAYTYDNNGNTLTKSDSSLTNQDESFAYDALNRLVETKRGPPATQTILGRYDYNAEGLRVRHRLSERGDVDYYYDDNAVIEEHNAADNSLLAHYRYADRLISLDTGSAKQYYHHDALGSTVNLTTASAALQVAYKIDPWGHIRDQQGTSVNRQIFTGQEHDLNTGLIYFGARYYDPDTARFITQDSYLGESGTPPSLHRYLYAYSNPALYVDLYGFAVVIGGNESKLMVKSLKYLHADHHNQGAEKWSRIIDAILQANPDFSREDAVDYVREKYSEFGIDGDNFAIKATVTVEAGDGLEEIKDSVLNYLGKGFRNAVASDKALRRQFEKFIQRTGFSAGQTYDISEFWEMAYIAMQYRAIYQNGRTEPYRHVYEDKAGWYELADKYIANVRLHAAIAIDDDLAPPSERIDNAWKLGVDVIDMTTLAYGVGKLAIKAPSLLRGAGGLFRNYSNFGASFFDDLALQATRNPNSNKVILGKFLEDGKSYTKVAAHYRGSYFKLKNWNQLANTLTQDELWKINEAFLRQQIKQGKEIILSHNPAIATGFYAKEIEFLEKLGYQFVKDGWVWKAIR